MCGGISGAIMSKVYNFQIQLDKGKQAEIFLDSYFCGEFEITEASRQEQMQGIDRWFKKKQSDNPKFSIEYKTDWRASETHNAFIETVSVDTGHRLGWVYTCGADYLLYYIPKDELIYIVKPAKLRNKIDKWIREYKEREIDNNQYYTRGVPVPLREFEAVAEKVLSI